MQVQVLNFQYVLNSKTILDENYLEKISTSIVSKWSEIISPIVIIFELKSSAVFSGFEKKQFFNF